MAQNKIVEFNTRTLLELSEAKFRNTGTFCLWACYKLCFLEIDQLLKVKSIIELRRDNLSLSLSPSLSLSLPLSLYQSGISGPNIVSNAHYHQLPGVPS